MADYASNMWRLVKDEEEDSFPHKSFYSLDPYTIYMETDKKIRIKLLCNILNKRIDKLIFL